MKKLLVTIFPLLFCSCYSFGQLNGPPHVRMAYPRVDTYPIGGSLKIERDLPLIIIGSLETNTPSLIMDPDNLIIVKTFHEPSELKHFGAKGVNGVMVAELKTKIPLLNLEEVLDYFDVPASHRYLKILVDKNLIDPDLFLADIKKIKKIEVFEVTQQDVLSSLIYNHWVKVKGEKYLNIITVRE